MKSTILLCKTQMDMSYVHTIDFETRTAQYNYFLNNTGSTIEQTEVNTKLGAFLTNMTIERDMSHLRMFDYVVLIPYDDENRKYYFFITSMEMISKSATRLNLKCDVFQSYMFDFEIKPSFVERCHVRRWNLDGTPTDNNLDEGLDYGPTVIHDRQTLKKVGQTYILSTTTPIGELTSQGGGGDIDGGSTGDWQNGVMSSKGFRFMKGYEGFGKYLYRDSGGVLTIGYGITQSEPSYYNELVNAQPVTEEHASKISYKVKQERYGKPIIDFCKSIGVTTQNQFDALCDLAFNAGVGAVEGTEEYTSLPNALKTDPFNESYVRPIWEKYLIRDDHGQPQDGLVARRKAECDIYFDNIYEFRPIVTINADGSYGPVITENNGNGWLPTDPIKNKFYTVNNDYGNNWIVPVEGRVSATYPYYPSGGEHTGIDIACPIGTPVHVSKDGVCIKRRELTTSYGKYLFIDHGDGLVTIYAHNSELLINEGDTVKAGQIIAKSGDTGNSQGPHCHWELRVNGVTKNIAPTLEVNQVIKYPV